MLPENGNGWIDFENEIKNIIIAVSEFPNVLIKKTNYNKEIEYSLQSGIEENIAPFLLYVLDYREYYFPYNGYGDWKDEDILQFYSIVHDEIKALINLFKKYIAWIEMNHMDNLKEINLFNNMLITNILTFNYTDTYRTVYDLSIYNEIEENSV